MKTLKTAGLVGVAAACVLLVAAEVGAWAPTLSPLQTFLELDVVTAVSVIGVPGTSALHVRLEGSAVGNPAIVEWHESLHEAAALSCQRAAGLVMARPGRFRLKLEANGAAFGCTLVAAPAPAP